MTEQQLSAVKSLASRFNSDLKHTDIAHDPPGLPENWIQAVVMYPIQDRRPHLCDRVAIVAGISPEGNVHT